MTNVNTWDMTLHPEHINIIIQMPRTSAGVRQKQITVAEPALTIPTLVFRH